MGAIITSGIVSASSQKLCLVMGRAGSLGRHKLGDISHSVLEDVRGQLRRKVEILQGSVNLFRIRRRGSSDQSPS